MTTYRKQVTLILLFVFILTLGGLYGTNHVMKRNTMYANDDFFYYAADSETLAVKVLGLNFTVQTKQGKDKFLETVDRLKSVLGRIKNIDKSEYFR